MIISFDAQLLFEKQKTGIGCTVENLLMNIIKAPESKFYLNYFSLRNNVEKGSIINNYKELGYHINKCAWFHNYLYKKSWNTFPIPYTFFFGKKTQITQFFNYDVPPGVKGVAVTFIYDMVYKAFPQTIDKKTMDMLDYNLSKACKRADHIITISEFSKNEIVKYMGIPAEKISIMHCGVDLSIFHRNYDEESIMSIKAKYSINSDYLLYLGTLEPRKNIVKLIEGYYLLKKEMANVPKLVLAGKKGWLYDDIFLKVKELCLDDDIIFTGYIEPNEIPLLLGGANAFIFPSLYEGFGLPPLEAMACGTPVIVSNTASLPEVVGDAGLYVNPFKPAEIYEAMKLIISNVELKEELINKGLERAQMFKWENSAKELMKIYKRLL